MDAPILLVEDDPSIVENLTDLLEREGYAVRCAATQEEALASADAEEPSLALLDVTLAQGNGFAVCSAIKRDHPRVPVIFLTASGDEPSTVTGLGLGADDYVAKPFRPRELLARIEAIVRRSTPRPRTIAFGELVVDAERARATRAGAEIPLSALEYRLLLLFASMPGRLVTREHIREALWEEAGTYIEENTVSVYIKRLRSKVERDPAHPELIQTVRGLGYRAGC